MTDPKLAAPGAGIPAYERLIVKKLVMPFAYATRSWEKSQQDFIIETNKITSLYKRIDAHDRQHKILIKRLRGIEDSSRFWSADMTLEHLIIVTTGITRTIEELAQENPSYVEVRIADVKPTGIVTNNMLEMFTDTMQQAHSKLAGIENRRSRSTLAHPWFGPMNTYQWHTLLPMHQRIHRHQLERILKGLKLGKKS